MTTNALLTRTVGHSSHHKPSLGNVHHAANWATSHRAQPAWMVVDTTSSIYYKSTIKIAPWSSHTGTVFA
jgi:hypothetical protein